jgi:acetoacetyl-CoA synthetase
MVQHDGWMMWNLLISGLGGSDGCVVRRLPGRPDLSTLWELAESERADAVRYVGSVHPDLSEAGLRPAELYDLTALQAVRSTGAPLTPEGSRWVSEAVGSGGQIASVSGGTDLCTAFVGAAPDVPVWLGELSCRMLGAAVQAFDETARPVVDDVGELVLTDD